MPVAVVPTTIVAVTVHRNGALVTRRGRGHGDVEVRGLPLLFAADSLRVHPERGTVRHVEETVTLHSTPAPAPGNDDAQAKVALELARVDDELRAVDSLMSAFGGWAPAIAGDRGLEPKLVDAERWLSLLTVPRARAEALAARRRALELQRRELERERRRLDERGVAIPNETPRLLRGARFELSVAEPVSFAVEYFVPAARWVPTYALHLEPGSAASLVTAALVAQASGEDWSGVALSVSTADLTRETTLPVLSSWRIGKSQPPVARGFRLLPTDLPTLFHGYDRGPRRPAASTAPPPAPNSAGSTGPVRRLPSAGPPPPQALLASRVDMHDDDEGGGQIDSAEAVAFETEHSSNARPSLGAALAFEDAKTDAEAAVAPRGAALPPSAVPTALQMRTRQPPRTEVTVVSRPAFGAGAITGVRPRIDDDARRPQPELPPRWRTASMRMAGADEPARGCLVPLDPIARLAWLLQAHDVDGAGSAELAKAVQALQQAQARLEQAPLPMGTSALVGTHLQAVMHGRAPTDVPGDGTFYRVEVRVDEAPASIEHRCVPRESKDVWRVCRLPVQNAALPAGPLAVHEGGAFKVNTHFDPSARGVGGALEINLGVDPDVRVLSRTVLTQQSESPLSLKGIMGQGTRVAHDVDVELRSTRPTPVKMVVHDRLPVPADNVRDVTVSVLEEEPPIHRTDRDAHGLEVPGGFEWRVGLSPGETHRLSLRYAIDLPAKAELEGGNRRE